MEKELSDLSGYKVMFNTVWIGSLKFDQIVAVYNSFKPIASNEKVKGKNFTTIVFSNTISEDNKVSDDGDSVTVYYEQSSDAMLHFLSGANVPNKKKEYEEKTKQMEKELSDLSGYRVMFNTVWLGSLKFDEITKAYNNFKAIAASVKGKQFNTVIFSRMISDDKHSLSSDGKTIQLHFELSPSEMRNILGKY